MEDFDSSYETEQAECSRCGEVKKCIVSIDPYMNELYPEEENQPDYWCFECYDTRSGDI